MQHLIKKQVIALDIPKSIKSFEVQQTVRDYYLREILPAMEKVFDELSGEEETIFIDQLEIDLGSISENDIARNKWDVKIISGITEQLRKKIKKKKEKPAGYEPRALSVCKQWLFYMERGWLPWNALRINETWYQQVLEALATDYSIVSELRTLILSKPAVVKRIVFQQPQTFLEKLVEILTAEKQSGLADAVVALQEMFHNIKRFDVSAYNAQALQNSIWQQVIRFAVVQGTNSSQDILIQKAILYYLPDISMLKTIVRDSSLTPGIILPVLIKIVEHPEHLLHEPETERKEKPQKERGVEIDEQLNKERYKKQGDEDIHKQMYQQQIDEEGIFVLNAGIVLLHAFLTKLLNRLQWVNHGRFVDEQTRQKTLYLIHYMATGKTDAEEHELIIPKVLCAWNLNNPVEKEAELTTGELSEAENMMGSSIEQWTVLKNTSIEGLREGFLQRNGKLYSRNGNVYLQVEQNAIDILLDQLPWNLSIIKLPWMKEILRVEWR